MPAILRLPGLFMMLLLSPLILASSVWAQVHVVGTSSRTGNINVYGLAVDGTDIRVSPIESFAPTTGSGHLIGNFIEGRSEELLRVRRLDARQFEFSATTGGGKTVKRKLKLSRTVGNLFYLLSDFDLDKNGLSDLAIIDISSHTYRWYMVANPLSEGIREVESFTLGFAGDRVEWISSVERGIEFLALRQSPNSERTRLLLRRFETGTRRVLRFRWPESNGILIPIRLRFSKFYDPSVALYSPANREVLLFANSKRPKSLALPRQRCAGVQIIAEIEGRDGVSALELCPNGEFVLAQRAKNAADITLNSGTLPESLTNIRRIDHTKVRGEGLEIPVVIAAPGSTGEEIINNNPQPVVSVPVSEPSLTPTPMPTPTSTPVVASVSLPQAPASYSTIRSIVSSLSGNNFSEWRYAFGDDNLICENALSWSAWLSSETPLSLDLGYPGRKVLCLQGRVDSQSDPGPTREYRWFLGFENDLDLSTIQNLSLSAPLLPAVNDSNDTRSKLSDGCIDNRGNSTVTVNNTIYFIVLCNHINNSIGWSACLAEWDGISASANWIDSNTELAGFQAPWSKCSRSSNGTTFLGNLYRYTMTALADGRIFGTYNGSGPGCSPALSSNGFYPMVGASFSTLSSSSTLSSYHNWAQPIEAGTWRASYDRYGSWVNADENDVIWIYNTSRDANSIPYFWAISKTAGEYTSATTVPNSYLVADYRSGMVRRKDSTYHFIGYHVTRQRWEHVLGRSPLEFDWEHPTNLGLETLLSEPDRWFSGSALSFAACGSVAGPFIHSFEIQTDPQGETGLNLFYRAGDIATRTATAARGIGVIRIKLGNTLAN